MTEREWVESIARRLRRETLGRSVEVETGLRLAYGHEIIAYHELANTKAVSFETDLAIVETAGDGSWKPRVVVEAKLQRISTHDAITYSHKARSHCGVYPYLRYGMMLGSRRRHPLPGRLYRHGVQFDFLMSFVGVRPSSTEWAAFIKLIKEEIKASRTLEELLYDSRKQNRQRFTMLHRKLTLR